MDVVTASFLVLGLVGAIGVILHYAGYIPRPYRDRLERTERTLAENLNALPPKIGQELEAAMTRFAAYQETKYQEAAQGAVKSAEMSMVRSVGVDKQFRARVDTAVSEAVLGPALPVLRQFAPGLAEFLEQNPQAVDVILEHPLFLKHVAPRLSQFLGKSDEHVVSSGSWGT